MSKTPKYEIGDILSFPDPTRLPLAEEYSMFHILIEDIKITGTDPYLRYAVRCLETGYAEEFRISEIDDKWWYEKVG